MRIGVKFYNFVKDIFHPTDTYSLTHTDIELYPVKSDVSRNPVVTDVSNVKPDIITNRVVTDLEDPIPTYEKPNTYGGYYSKYAYTSNKKYRYQGYKYVKRKY